MQRGIPAMRRAMYGLIAVVLAPTAVGIFVLTWNCQPFGGVVALLASLGVLSAVAVHVCGRAVFRGYSSASVAHDVAIAAEQRVKERAFLFAQLSHEMNSPLLAISGAAELIGAGARVPVNCERIQVQVDRLAAQIRKIVVMHEN